jgi:hypothetical protein
MTNQLKQYEYKVVGISIKTPFQELIDHIIKEEQQGWKLFSVQAIVDKPFTYVVTLYK